MIGSIAAWARKGTWYTASIFVGAPAIAAAASPSFRATTPGVCVAAAKQDPVAYRRALLSKSPRARAVLDLAAQAAGWGQPLPAGRGRGVSLLYSGWGSYLAQVAEVAVSESGEVRVHRIVCAVDCGTPCPCCGKAGPSSRSASR